MKDKKVINDILTDKVTRTDLMKKSHYWFFHYYFSHYIVYKTASFQRELFRLTEKQNYPLTAVVAFRGSGKTTIIGVSYPIWAIIGKQQKKFVLLLGQTQHQAQEMLQNIKTELESNTLLKQDLGKFYEQQDPWNRTALLIPKYNAKIMAVSSEQSVRGLRFGAHRPDLIIGDDVEDLRSTEQSESRDKNYRWFKREIIPLGDKNTKIMMIGNLLHEDALLMRLIQEMRNEQLLGCYRLYPLINEQQRCLWPEKFTDKELERLKQTLGDYTAWSQEYLLKVIPRQNQVIQPSWIQYYDALPTDKTLLLQETAIGVDVALSLKESADYSAMVPVKVYGDGDQLKIYVLPNIINQRLPFSELLEMLETLSYHLGGGQATQMYIEHVALQGMVTQALEARNLPATGIVPQGDKYYRLKTISHLIQNGTILFPKHGAERLIEQLVGFGQEHHDDLCDALTLIVPTLVANHRYSSDLVVSDGRSIFDMELDEFQEVTKESELISGW